MDRLNTIDGETLMSKPLQPLNFVVDTLISQGLHILAGSPKVGKSWLALWLAVTVAKGEPVWGLPVKQGIDPSAAGTACAALCAPSSHEAGSVPHQQFPARCPASVGCPWEHNEGQCRNAPLGRMPTL